MNQSAAVSLTLLALVLAANLPFFWPRQLLVGPKRPGRGIGWRLLELLLLGLLALGLGLLFESRVGQRHAQGWAFYVSLLCLLLTFAFPGFVWRHLRKGQPDPAADGD